MTDMLLLSLFRLGTIAFVAFCANLLHTMIVDNYHQNHYWQTIALILTQVVLVVTFVVVIILSICKQDQK
jgi:uncharacterized membrane protein